MPFTIGIDANTSMIAKSMAELKNDLKQFRKELEKATDTSTITRLNKAIKETDVALKAIKGFDGKKIAVGADAAATSVLNMSRIVSDAPFGFIAISNNLEPLFMSFQQIKAQTGSTSAAFKALGSSLIGPAGLGLAFSLVTSALTMFAMSSRGAKHELEGFDKAMSDANNAAGNEIARLKILGNVIEDTTRTTVERKKAAHELSGVLKDLNIKMTEEQLLNGQVATAVDLATAAIVRRAKARAIEDRVGQLAGEQLTRDLRRVQLTDKLTEAEKKRNQALNDRGKIKNKDEREAAGIDQFFNQSKVTDLTDDIYDLDKATAKAGKEMADLLAMISNEDLTVTFKGGGKNDPVVDMLKKRIDALKELQSLTGLDLNQRIELSQLEVQLANRDGIKMGFKREEIAEKVQAKINEIFPQEFLNFRVRGVFQIEPELSIVKKPQALTEGFQTDIAKAIGLPEIITPPAMTIGAPASIKADPFAEAIGNAFADSFALIGESIGKSFATGDFMGGLKDAAQGILGILGDVLISIGKQLIVTSALVKALKAALKGIFGPGGDAAALAVGIGLVAFGGLMKNIQFNGPKMADGGVVSQSTLANIGEAGTEVVMPLTKLPYLMNQNGGGGGNMVVGLRVKGRELIALLERESTFAKRMG